jgi:hypothetical protein
METCWVQMACVRDYLRARQPFTPAHVQEASQAVSILAFQKGSFDDIAASVVLLNAPEADTNAQGPQAILAAQSVSSSRSSLS